MSRVYFASWRGAREQTRLRLTRIGFVFQTFNLMPTLSALENVALPMRLAGVGRREHGVGAGAD